MKRIEAKSRVGLVAVVLAVALVCGLAGWWVFTWSGDDDATSSSAAVERSPAPTLPTVTAAPTTSAPTTPSPETSAPTTPTPTTPPTTAAPQPLPLSCGGAYPTLLFSTVTSASKVSVCGKDATGEEFRVVVQRDGRTFDGAGNYVWQDDAFETSHEGTRYVASGVDGSVTVTRDGSSKREESRDFSSHAVENDDS